MHRPVCFPSEATINILEVVRVFGGGNLTFHLFKNALVIDNNTTLAALTEADYSGYSSYVIAQDITSALDDGTFQVTGPKAINGLMLPVFPGNSGADQTVYGAYATYNTGTEKLFWAGNVFDEHPETTLNGRVISGPSDSVVLAVRHLLWDYLQDTNQFPLPKMEVLIDSGGTVTINARNKDGTIDDTVNGTWGIWCIDPTASSGGFRWTEVTVTDGTGTAAASSPPDNQIYLAINEDVSANVSNEPVLLVGNAWLSF